MLRRLVVWLVAFAQCRASKRSPSTFQRPAGGCAAPIHLQRANATKRRNDHSRRRMPSGAPRVVPDQAGKSKEIEAKRSERVADGGRRSAGTAVYISVHEDAEHRRMPSGARAVALLRFPSSVRRA